MPAFGCFGMLAFGGFLLLAALAMLSMYFLAALVRGNGRGIAFAVVSSGWLEKKRGATSNAKVSSHCALMSAHAFDVQ